MGVNITNKLGQSDILFLEIQNGNYALISCKMRKFFVVSMLTCLVFVCKGQKKEEKSLIECYTCGLETEDPELDVARSYGVRVYSTEDGLQDVQRELRPDGPSRGAGRACLHQALGAEQGGSGTESSLRTAISLQLQFGRGLRDLRERL